MFPGEAIWEPAENDTRWVWRLLCVQRELKVPVCNWFPHFQEHGKLQSKRRPWYATGKRLKNNFKLGAGLGETRIWCLARPVVSGRVAWTVAMKWVKWWRKLAITRNWEQSELWEFFKFESFHNCWMCVEWRLFAQAPKCFFCCGWSHWHFCPVAQNLRKYIHEQPSPHSQEGQPFQAHKTHPFTKKPEAVRGTVGMMSSPNTCMMSNSTQQQRQMKWQPKECLPGNYIFLSNQGKFTPKDKQNEPKKVSMSILRGMAAKKCLPGNYIFHQCYILHLTSVILKLYQTKQPKDL